MEVDQMKLFQDLIEIVDEISPISDYKNAFRKPFCNLSRRLKLLTPMFEELRDSKEPVSEETIKGLIDLKETLRSSMKVVKVGSAGSKIYLILEGDRLMKKFQEVTDQLEQALGRISYDKIDLSDEVREQVELVHSQFKRAKGQVSELDGDIYNDLLSIHNSNNDSMIDPAILGKLAEKLQLMTIEDLTQESMALHEMVSTGCGFEDEIEKISMTLKKIKEFVLIHHPELCGPGPSSKSPPNFRERTPSEARKSPIPQDFCCPISLELMEDPVIVSTGQTYDRNSIRKWLDGGHNTCPKTQEALTSNILTPNYVLRSLIYQWCEENGVEPPKRSSTLKNNKPSTCTHEERAKIDSLLKKLLSSSIEEQRAATIEIRLLAKRNADNRICIAKAGAIPLLIPLLLSSDVLIQEHAVTSLLNLSICEENKRKIMSENPVPGIIHVLKVGSMEARENAAATLFSLSVLDEYKVRIGQEGAIQALVALLSEGSQRGKKDAATALFNLCIYQVNKGKAVRAGIVSVLMRLVTEPDGNMLDEALAIMAILASHPEGRSAIGAAEAVPVLVNLIKSGGSPRNRENAAAVLVNLSSGDGHHLVEIEELGAREPLLDLAKTGTDRGKRKATQLLERLMRFIEEQRRALTPHKAQFGIQTQVQEQTQAVSLVQSESQVQTLPEAISNR